MLREPLPIVFSQGIWWAQQDSMWARGRAGGSENKGSVNLDTPLMQSIFRMQSIFSPAARRQDGRLMITRAPPRRWAKDVLR